MKKNHYSDSENLSPTFRHFCAFITLILGPLFSGAVQAQLPEPAVSISIVLTDQFRYLTSADRRFGVPFNLYSHVLVDGSDPVSAERVDVYVGFIRPDGVWMTWPDDPKPYGFWVPEVGVQPLVRNAALSGGGFVLPGRSVDYLQYVFKPEDLPGIYQWFTLVVRAGKPADDVSQWITMRTKMLPVK